MVNPVCPECGSPIYGRADKRFCTDQCRATHNRKARSERERLLVKTNHALRRNRNILSKLCPYGKAVVRRQVLVKMGYDFSCYTSIFTTKRSAYYVCYDYAFTPIIEKDVEKALIVSRQEYMHPKNPWELRNPLTHD